MLSWYSITVGIGLPLIPFNVLVIVYLVWSTRQLMKNLDKRWEDVHLGGAGNRVTAVGMPGSGKMLELKIGGSVSSTSSVHPTKETWLNIQSSSQMSSNNNTAKTTMRDLQEMFENTKESPSAANEDNGVTRHLSNRQEASTA